MTNRYVEDREFAAGLLQFIYGRALDNEAVKSLGFARMVFKGQRLLGPVMALYLVLCDRCIANLMEPERAKPLLKELWEQHYDRMRSNARYGRECEGFNDCARRYEGILQGGVDEKTTSMLAAACVEQGGLLGSDPGIVKAVMWIQLEMPIVLNGVRNLIADWRTPPPSHRPTNG